MTRQQANQKPRSWIGVLVVVLLLGTLLALEYSVNPVLVADPDSGVVYSTETAADFLPPEAHATLELIDRGGPYPYRQDGTVFHNREGHLPEQARGYYREFTVDTPGLRHRGARRIVTGGQPPSEWYYTDDHYQSFRAFQRAGRL